MLKAKIWILIIFGLIVIDQFTKFIAAQSGWPIFYNDEFAFSLPLPFVLMYLIYALVIIGIAVYLYRTWNRLNKIQHYAWCFVLAGGLSNIGERLVLGAVTDFIPIANGMLNMADFFIIIGLLLLLTSRRYKIEERASEKVS
jgi:lipoprotein signal peptidase